MEDIFHYKWLMIGNPDNRYSKEFETVPLQKNDKESQPISVQVKAGYTCKSANQLRNNNCQRDIFIPERAVVTEKKLIETKTGALYNCGNKFLARHHGIWALYDETISKKIAEGNWGNNESDFFCFDSGFYIFDNTLNEFSADGELRCQYFLSSGSDLKHHEVARIDDFTISAGYLTSASFPDGLPGNIQPSGQLESIRQENFELPEDRTDPRSASESKMLAFVEINSLIPIYLDNLIIQPLKNKIALLNYDLEILKVIEGDFQPLAVSAGFNSYIYMAAHIEDEIFLIGLDLEGQILFQVPIPATIGYPVASPTVMSNNVVCWVGENGIGAYDKKGELLWMQSISGLDGNGTYPLAYNDVLTICFNGECMAINSNGEILFRIGGLGRQINTPLMTNQQGQCFVGTEDGIYEIIIQ